MTHRSNALLLSVAALFGCAPADFSAPAQPESWTDIGDARWRALAVTPGGEGFTAVPPQWSGVSFANRLAEASMVENQMLTNGSGVAVADVDGDGLVDLYFARLDGPNALYRNLGNWRFEDATQESGLRAADRFSTGAAFADVDGDDDPDLLLAAIGGGVSLFLNDGGGRFTESASSGLRGGTGAMSLALADVEGDGDLDLYVTNYKRRSVLDLFPPAERDFASTVRRTPTGFAVAERFAAHYELSWTGSEVRRLEKGEPDAFYRNDGSGRFEHVSLASGAFRGPDGRPLASAPMEWGLAARFGDLDDDGDPDLYVVNDLHSPDRLWLNDGAGEFREIAPTDLRTTSASSMAVDFSDVDRDGDVDIFTLDMLSRSSRLRKTQDPVARVERVLPGDAEGTQQVARNALLLSRGDGSFAEVAHWAGVEASDWSWSALFLDVDLDGFEDLLIPNGHVRDLMDADTQERLRETRLEDWRQTLLLFDPLPLANVAFRNRGDGRFEEVGERWGFAGDPDIGHGAALADLDGDGDLDAVVNRLGDPALLLRNDAGAPRLAVRLSGIAPNGAGVGARVSVEVDGLPTQTKEIGAGGGYLSGSEPLATFAMGTAASATIEVRWRSGVRSRVSVDGADRLYEIREPAGEASPPAEPAASSDPARAPWFAPDDAFAPLHDDPLFEDPRQPLLPYRLGQLGPQVAWHDLDADGDPDLMMTSGAGAAPAFFRNEDGELRRLSVSGPTVPVDQSGLVPLPSGSGDGRLVLALSSYEAPDADAVPGAIELAWGPGGLEAVPARIRVSPLVPGAPSASGPLAMADVDGDGWLDLFVGGRVLPGRYPEPADSRLLRGRPGGGFQSDPADETALRGVGLVSGALFSDLDVDGDPDLVLATEWGPVRVLENEGGRLVDASAEWGLAELSSRWTAVASGDFDGDGRPDLVATSWGENTELRATAERPLEVYYGDVDRNGTIEVIEAQFDPRIRDVAPLVSFRRLGRAVPGVLERLGTHARYADASLDAAVGGTPEGRAAAVTLAHTVFLNRGERFEARRLPREAQWSPSLGVAVADADGDGAEDIFLAQNLFATDEDSPRYDAGRSAWFRGDGAGSFAFVPAAVSGVELIGDPRGVAVADVDGDARPDLVVGQNGGAARLFRNRTGRPGLRVRLVGPPGNPYGIGASIRLVYDGAFGPAREVRAGSSAGSHDDPVQVLGIADPAALAAVDIRWPGGREQTVLVDPDQRELTVRHPDAERGSP